MSSPSCLLLRRSFAMTQRYLVLMVWPLLLSLPKMALFGAPGKAMAWTPDKGTMFYVVDKEQGGHVATYK
jgi:carotenoid cleavage dioxygenase-like enzyme